MARIEYLNVSIHFTDNIKLLSLLIRANSLPPPHQSATYYCWNDVLFIWRIIAEMTYCLYDVLLLKWRIVYMTYYCWNDVLFIWRLIEFLWSILSLHVYVFLLMEINNCLSCYVLSSMHFSIYVNNSMKELFQFFVNTFYCCLWSFS